MLELAPRGTLDVTGHIGLGTQQATTVLTTHDV